MKMYDVIVIGGGGAGLSAAFTTAGFGKKTLLVEKAKTGGECTWSGCIPSKALIHLAEINQAAREAGAEVSIPKPFDQVDQVRQTVYSHESPEVLAKRGVETLIGAAKFTGKNTIEVNGETYSAKRFILAIGSKALVPPVPGLASTPHLTNETLFALKSVPKSVLVMGGGPIGLEMAQALRRLGAEITVVEMLDRVLFREDPDTAAVVERKLVAEGITLLTGTKAVEAAPGASGVTLTVEADGKRRTLEAEALLVAVGRGSAVAGLDVEAAGIVATPKGVKTDAFLRTANSAVYAAGDVAGPYAFSHMAEYQGVLAALNAILPFRKKVNYNHVAWATFTDPEIARAGMTEDEARQSHGSRIRIYTHRYENLDRGMTVPGTEGLVKIILDSKGRVLGAHVAGPRAGEIICEIQVMKTFGIGFHKLKNVIHPYPTYADILRQIAKKAALDRILNHPVVRTVRALSGKKNAS
ncbi:MAG: FAD-dependent oxidoreductase [Spirochaetales bacterium]|nr:FAD-dependent oxidoreductase [Spirochaetales bacterium]